MKLPSFGPQKKEVGAGVGRSKPRFVGWGLAFWILFAFLAVAARGVRWDEQYEFAQVITGTVAYPDGHPYPYCVYNALNLQIYATAGLHWLAPDAALVCGFRNVLYLLATVVPVYLLGALLGGGAIVGHVAAATMLLGLHEEFDACYQMFAWPGYASTGHVGLGYALTALALLAGGRLRAGAFMLGLMPCVHIGQMPILLGWALVTCAVAMVKDKRAATAAGRRAAPFLTAGLVLCALVWANRGAVHVPLADAGPYFSSADPAQVWAGYVSQDSLRALPGRPTSYTNSFIMLAGALLITSWAAWRRGGAWRAVWLYVALVAGAVWGVMTLHYLLGEKTPYMLIAWMPYRFANHAAYVLVAALAGLAFCGPARWLVLGVMLVGAVRPWLGLLLPEAFHLRYLAGGEGLLFTLAGAALAFLYTESPRRIPTAVVLTAAALALAVTHQFGAACMVAGLAAALALAPKTRAAAPSAATAPAAAVATAAAVVVLVLALALANQAQHRMHLPSTQFEREVVRHLADKGDDGAMLLARPEQYTLQAKSGHPVVADCCLAPWIPYMPSIGPAIEKIHRDFYGETFAPPDKAEWWILWAGRSLEDWQALGSTYGVRYVISPNHVPLNLPAAVKGQLETLYRIPWRAVSSR